MKCVFKRGKYKMLGSKIGNYIIENGNTKADIARKIGMSVNAFTSITNEKRKVTAEEYYKICEALEVPLDFFFD